MRLNAKRLMDLALAILATGFLLVPAIVVALLVRWTSPGPVLYWSDRVGQYNRIFRMPKFRSMRINTPAVATHMLDNPASYLTPIGSFLRKSSLDEIPQLWSILVGDMSFVGPRPALFNQYDLIELRTRHGVHELVPGLTGWAQINGSRGPCHTPDEVRERVRLDMDYVKRASIWLDAGIVVMTIPRLLGDKQRCR